MNTANSWVFASWRDNDLLLTAAALQTMNPSGFRNAESSASYIRNLAETELNRRLNAGNDQPFDIGTGGFVVFMNKRDGVWHAIAAVTGYTAAHFIADCPFPGQECCWVEKPTGEAGKTYKCVSVRQAK